MSALGPTIVCGSEDRRNAVAASAALDGIDYLEVDESALPPTLHVHFLRDVSGAGLTPGNFTVAGGERITNVAVTKVTPNGSDVTVLDLLLNEQGDFSPYVLVFGPAGAQDPVKFWQAFDPQLKTTAFHFHLSCPTLFDCKPVQLCPPALPPPVAIDYLARDYATFRQTMLDRISLLAPSWTETNAADAGIALVELIAYAADRLSYRQDATATEAYLETARLRTSVRRHVHLVDYPMHEGCNARAWLHLEVTGGGTLLVPAGTRFVTQLPGLPASLPNTADTFETIALAGAQIFESLGSLTIDSNLNRMPFYNWSAGECCLPVGATQATLAGAYKTLQPGTALIFAEILGPQTGNPEDTDPQKRHAVVLTSFQVTTDPLTSQAVTNIWWDADDALPFPLCIAHTETFGDNRVTFTPVSAAFGNVVLVDNGRTLGAPVETTLPELIGAVVAGRRFRPALAQKNLTFAGANPYSPSGDGTFTTAPGTYVSAKAATSVDPAKAFPFALKVSSQEFDPLTHLPVGAPVAWQPVVSLFDPAIQESPNALVVEMENDRTAYLRFGDGVDGALPDPGLRFNATYRVGNGSAGNVGAETIVHVIGGLTLAVITNPLAAAGGTDPESLADVRINAPYAFNTQERAVTLADYAAFAQTYPLVLRAVAVARVTRSWRTIFITVELKGGLGLLSPGVTPGNTIYQDLEALLDLYRMAGNDVEFENVKLVALDVAMHVCVDPDYRRDEVTLALVTLFSSGLLPDGTPGFFYPDRFVMGQTYYLGPLIAAAQNVPGVASVEILTFQRSDAPGNAGLAAGFLTPAINEAFTLRNDPNYPERGTFTLTVDGGR
jgi:hypothetical protein